MLRAHESIIFWNFRKRGNKYHLKQNSNIMHRAKPKSIGIFMEPATSYRFNMVQKMET